MLHLATLLVGALLLQGPSLDSPSPKERMDAVERMTKPGNSESIPILEAALKKEPRSDVREEIVSGLSRIGGPGVVPVLTGTLAGDLDKDVRLQAVDAILHLYIPLEDNGTLRTLFNRVKNTVVEAERPLVGDGVSVDAATKESLAAAMQKDAADEVRAAAARALGSLRAADQVPALIAALENPQNREHASVRLEVVRSLGILREPAAGPALTTALRDSDRDTMSAAITAVGMVGYKEGRPQLEELFRNGKTREVKRTAIESIALLRDPGATPLFESLLSSPDDLYREKAAEGLARVDYDGNRLKEMFKLEKKASVRYAVAFAIASSGQNEYINDLANALDSRQADQADVYLYELGKYRGKLDELHRYLRSSNPTVRARMVRVVGDIGDPASRPFIESLTKDDSVAVLQEANAALRKMNSR